MMAFSYSNIKLLLENEEDNVDNEIKVVAKALMKKKGKYNLHFLPFPPRLS